MLPFLRGVNRCQESIPRDSIIRAFAAVLWCYVESTENGGVPVANTGSVYPDIGRCEFRLKTELAPSLAQLGVSRPRPESDCVIS